MALDAAAADPGAGTPPSAGTAASRGAPVARAAAQLTVLTMASRLAGFARMLVFVWAVGAATLGDIYSSANTVPNIIFEIVAGGALASLVVPLLARPVTAGDTAAVGATASALLTWVLTLLVPAAIGVALAAEPLIRLLAPRHTAPATIAVGADMLRVFAPQLPLYGIGIVLTGVLQAHRRFAWPVLAPLLSSVTAVAVYLTFSAVAGRKPHLGSVSGGALLILSGGTTLAVVVLSLCLLIPLRRLQLPVRLTYRFAPEAALAVRRLALAGVVTVAAQQLSLGLAIALAWGGPKGSVVLYGLAQTVYLLPWAVLALPIATSAYPGLAQAGAHGDRAGYAAILAPATRGLVFASCLGAAALGVLAQPVAMVLAVVTREPQHAAGIAAGVAGFAPGLVGYALFALLSRALYARGDTRLAAVATLVGWGGVALASVALAVALPRADRVAALAIANSAGMLLLGALLLAVVARRAGTQALAGLGRSAAVAVGAAAAATATGLAVSHAGWPVTVPATPAVGPALVQGMLCGAVVALVFITVAYSFDRRDVGPALAALTRRARRRTAGRAP